jgi:hypothetical protein
MTISYQVGGGGNMDIDFWVRSLSYVYLFINSRNVAGGPQQPRTRQTHQTIHRNHIHHCTKRWKTRILLLQPHEQRSRQDGQVTCKDLMFTCPSHVHSFNVHGIVYVSGDGKYALKSRVASFLIVPRCNRAFGERDSRSYKQPTDCKG